MNTYESDIRLEPVFTATPGLGGIQQVNFIPLLPLLLTVGSALLSGVGAVAGGAAALGSGAVGALASGAGALASTAVSAGAGAVGALGSAAGYLGSTAIGAGGTVLGGIGQLGGGIIDTGVGLFSGAGQALFGGGAVTPELTVGQQMAALAEPGFYETAGGGLFSNISLGTLADAATAGYGIYMSAEQQKLAEKTIEAQGRAGYVVAGTPGAPTTGFAPTTSVVIPAAGAAGAQLQTESQSQLIKYALMAIAAYLLLKGVK